MAIKFGAKNGWGEPITKAMVIHWLLTLDDRLRESGDGLGTPFMGEAVFGDVLQDAGLTSYYVVSTDSCCLVLATDKAALDDLVNANGGYFQMSKASPEMKAKAKAIYEGMMENRERAKTYLEPKPVTFHG